MEPIVRRLVEHDGQIICHHITASPSCSYSNLVKLHPLLRISFAVIGIDPENLEACGPLYSSQPCYERVGNHRLNGEEFSDAGGVTVLAVILLSALEFYLMLLGMTVLDAVMDIEVGVTA